jgi:NAD-dependent SIR2 family protein deacetylase
MLRCHPEPQRGIWVVASGGGPRADSSLWLGMTHRARRACPRSYNREMSSLLDFISVARRLVVLTGAGCSTESGIPDYRSPGGVWTRHKPIYYNSFVSSESVRRFYWARSYRGWPRFAAARPNRGNEALAALESAGIISHLITQNVDTLHKKAGSRCVTQLHGRNEIVVCLDCRRESPRAEMQQRLAALNEGWLARAPWQHLSADQAEFAPDGDAEIAASAVGDFLFPSCEECSGVLKPAVVFFGESVPLAVVAEAMSEVDRGDALLVVGSSLTVWSGFRFARRAGEKEIPIAILNVGPTRADDLAALKVEARCGDALSEVVEAMEQRGQRASVGKPR